VENHLSAIGHDFTSLAWWVVVVLLLIAVLLGFRATGGSQHVTVKHIHQQVNVTEGGQAVVAGDKVMSRTRGRRRSDGGGMVKNER
jgi:hypothetical protein